MIRSHDVIVIGEMLVELSSAVPLRDARELHVSFSGDALNSAAAAARAGATVALVTVVGDDEFGERLIACAEGYGIDTSLIERVARPNGFYIASRDPHGTREFVYLRQGSAATTLAPEHLSADTLRTAGALVISGIAAAISPSCRRAIERAATVVNDAGGAVVYDPNYRRRLTSVEAARAALRTLAPLTTVMTPSWPGDATALLGCDEPGDAAVACRDAGAAAVVLTLGADGMLLADELGVDRIAAVPAPSVVDATGCGDVFTGTLAARLAAGEPFREAANAGAAAASLAVGGAGGLGHVPAWEETLTHLARHSGSPTPK